MRDIKIQWLTQYQFCRMLGVNTRTAARWREAGYGPRAYRIGREIRYKRSDAEAWLDDQAVAEGEQLKTVAEKRAESEREHTDGPGCVDVEDLEKRKGWVD